MSPGSLAIADEGSVDANPPSDLSSLLESLNERLREPSVQERWFPGAAASTAHASTLPYYRVTTTESLTDLLEAALVRPAGIRFDFEDWLEAFDSRSRAERPKIERRSVAAQLRAAAAGGIAGGALGVGSVLVVLALLPHALRPSPYLAFAIALGGLVLTASVVTAIMERRWRTP